MNQNTAFEIFFPEIDCNGKIYRKYSLIKAFIAEGGEYIETWTADGLETTNYAKKGDFIVQNLQTEYLESYIIDNITFFERYGLLYFSGYEAICFPKNSCTIHYLRNFSHSESGWTIKHKNKKHRQYPHRIFFHIQILSKSKSDL